MKYTESLNKRVKRRPTSLLASAEQVAAADKAVFDEMYSKVPELFKVHGVEYGDWVALAWALACTHVPGFQLANPERRPTEWEQIDKAEFRIAVDEIRKATGKPLDACIEKVTMESVWASRVAKNGKVSIGAMRQHYYNADDWAIRLLLTAKAYDEIAKGNK